MQLREATVAAAWAACSAGGRTVAGHQVDHLPWLAYFVRMLRVDVFVELDCVQYNHGRFQNRNRIVDPSGRVLWLRVPVRAGKRRTQRMLDVQIADQPWRRPYLDGVRRAYAQHPHFAALYPELASIIERPWQGLLELNRAIRGLFLDWLAIGTPIPRQSELGLGDERGERLLIELARAVSGTRFLSGPTGRAFLDAGAFEAAALPLDFDAPFEARPYPQHGIRDFVPGLSALDLVMNLGRDAGPWLRDAYGIR